MTTECQPFIFNNCFMAALPQVGKSIWQTISNDSFEPDSRKLCI